MEAALSGAHYVYIAGILGILGFMICKKDTTVVCILGIFALGIAVTSSVYAAVCGVFNSFIIAINELSGTILIISAVAALCNLLEITGINEKMVSPITRFIKSPSSAYWITGIAMLAVSVFFWPSPAVALIGAVFLPAGKKAKLPPMGVAVAMNLFGHGIALSGDYVIQGAPKLVADGAGIEVNALISASIPLVIIMGIVTTVSAYFFLMRDIKKGKLTMEGESIEESEKDRFLLLSDDLVSIFSVLVPISFAINVIIMITANLSGGDATALIGGTSLFLVIIIAAFAYKGKSFEFVTENIVDGFIFGFKVFGPVIPIAAFFYLGDSAILRVFGEGALAAESSGLVNDLGLALSGAVPVNKGASAIAATLVGIITGLDGSGFSGLNLAGSVAKIFSVVLGYGVNTLAALGQIGGIWVGGGTIIPWAVIPVAAICGVSPVELAAKNLKPVAIGLGVTTLAAMFLM